MRYLLAAVLVLGGCRLLWDAAQKSRALRNVTGVARTLEGTAVGTHVDVEAVVAESPVIHSPLTGSPSVYWNVQVERIIARLLDASGLEREVDVDVSSGTPFWVTVEGRRIRVDVSSIRCNGGHHVLDRDQAAFERSVDIDGVTYTSPPAAKGSRSIKECALVPGQTIWVSGVLGGDSDGLVIAPPPNRDVVLDTKSFGLRSTAVRAIIVASIGVGILMVVVAGGLAT